ncbi:c-type cytochrome [Roseiconus nitratireducens]|nr:c-type cytochrome [Roseiconus nitratireducens]
MRPGFPTRCCVFTWLLVAALGSTVKAQPKGLKWVRDEPVPDWIWDAEGARDNQQIFLRKTFDLPSNPKSARLYTTCDNSMTLWVNGKEIGKSRDWPYPITQDIVKQLSTGSNSVAVQAKNQGGVAALVFKLVIEPAEGPATVIVSDPSWQMTSGSPPKGWNAKGFDASGWSGKLAALKKLGAQPWGIPDGATRQEPANVIAAEDISAPAGFVVEQVYQVPRDQEGSWVALTTLPDGRLVACDQGDKGAFLVRVRESSDGPTVDVEPIAVDEPGRSRRLSGAQGLLWAFDSLWFHKNGGHLYRIKDTDGDGSLDAAEEIPSATGGGEHGNHALIKTEDGEGIYMAGGNHAPLGDLSGSRVQSWDEDLLLPRMWDANGHARGKMAPGGWVTRLNPETLQQELICIGFRNEYDIALNRFGDMFTYDADMEWDLGAPWYRPTRICFVASGADYGWRSGTGKWPTYYEDSLPPVVEIGPGSPTGVVAGIGAKFPTKYQDALFALDWTFGTIYAIHLQPQGAGYTGSSEPFVTGSPLPVTDAVVGDDGALYFAVGGRGAQSALYRVRYTGDESTAAPDASLPAEAARAREQRKRLESFHGAKLTGKAAEHAVDTAWPFLSSNDRFLRAAARVAIESVPVELWADRALSESNPQAAITAAVALARAGDASYRSALTDRLVSMDPAGLSPGQLLGLLRAEALTCIRLGRPDAEQRQAMIAQLDPLLPHDNDDVNTELVRVLTYLDAPTVIAKTMRLIRNRKPPEIPDWSELATRNARYGGTVNRVLENHPPSREIMYALMLRNLRDGWTIEQRREYFEFLNEAAKGSGGASFPGFMRNIRDEALGNCSDAERLALQDITGEQYDPVPDFEIQPIEGPGRTWTLADARAEGVTRSAAADFQRGRSLYFAADCGKCHRFAGLGGNIGPDLTTIPRKFDVNYVVEHIIDPSKVISDQYQSSVVLTEDGRVLTGLVSQADGKVIVFPADAKPDPIEIDAEEVLEIKPSDVSQMPKGLIDRLNASELRDLLAYLMSGGEADNERVYGKR